MSTATTDHQNRIPEPSITRFLLSDTRMAPVWLILRLWLGYEWLHAAWGKWTEGGWVGAGAGEGVKGFAGYAVTQTKGEHPYRPYQRRLHAPALPGSSWSIISPAWKLTR